MAVGARWARPEIVALPHAVSAQSPKPRVAQYFWAIVSTATPKVSLVHVTLFQPESADSARVLERETRVTKSPPPVRRLDTARRLAILIVLYSIPASAVMQPVGDFDIWWHVRTGQWIVEEVAVPLTDHFSSFGHGKPWVAYSWLFEVLVHGLYTWLGLYGILLYRAVLVFAVAVAVHRFVAKREPRFLVATVLVALAFWAFAPLMTERPWLFTLLFFTLTLGAILDLRAGRHRVWVWVLPVLYALWANLHIQFIYGLFVLGLACAAPVLDRLLGRGESGLHADSAGTRDWWQLVALSLACGAATLINPYHMRLYTVVLDYATQPAAFQLVNEARAMDFRGTVDWIVLGLAGSAAFALGRRRRLSAFEALLLASAAYFSFHTQRDLWFVLLAAMAILTAEPCFPGFFIERFPLTRQRLAALAMGVVLVIGATSWRRNLSPSRLDLAIVEKFPARAADYVEDHDLEGPLYNHFDWGGYLIWRLPHLKVAIDGRTNLHRDERLLRSVETWAGERGWDSDPELRAAKVVIASAKGPLASLLRLHEGFNLVYEDCLAAVFVATPDRSGRAPAEEPSGARATNLDAAMR